LKLSARALFAIFHSSRPRQTAQPGDLCYEDIQDCLNKDETIICRMEQQVLERHMVLTVFVDVDDHARLRKIPNKSSGRRRKTFAN
jgi:hypothetical protein